MSVRRDRVRADQRGGRIEPLRAKRRAAVGMEHFVDHPWQRVPGEPRGDDGVAREAWLWRFRRPTGAGIERPRPPSRRMARAHMPRMAFLALAFGWTFAVAALLAVVLALRWLG
jgi:hypothetical protein